MLTTTHIEVGITVNSIPVYPIKTCRNASQDPILIIQAPIVAMGSSLGRYHRVLHSTWLCLFFSLGLRA